MNLRPAVCNRRGQRAHAGGAQRCGKLALCAAHPPSGCQPAALTTPGMGRAHACHIRVKVLINKPVQLIPAAERGGWRQGGGGEGCGEMHPAAASHKVRGQPQQRAAVRMELAGR